MIYVGYSRWLGWALEVFESVNPELFAGVLIWFKVQLLHGNFGREVHELCRMSV